MEKIDNPVSLELELVYETLDAFLVTDGDREFWLPKSICEYDHDLKWATLPEWLAIEKGMV